MLNLILTLAMTSTQPAVTTAQFKPCVWPNVCKTAPVQTAQFKPCVWPNVCKTDKAALVIEVAQFETCVFPKKCAKTA